jgi:hypothetical protein
MKRCGREAVLIITTNPAGTATNVARSRTTLRCGLETGHEGAHRDDEHKETWEPTKAERPTLFRHEDEGKP